MTTASQDRQIATRYARALFDVTVKNTMQDAVAAELAALVGLLGESAPFAHVCQSPLIAKEDKLRAMQEVGKVAALSFPVARFLETLARHNRLALLSDIEKAYVSLCRADRGEVEAVVTSARSLSAKDAKAVAAALEKAYGKAVSVEMRIDPRILGGIKIKVGSSELDASVAGKLTRAAERLYQGIAA
jgi:F-type H+-transporting ATPase subunit delta